MIMMLDEEFKKLQDEVCGPYRGENYVLGSVVTLSGHIGGHLPEDQRIFSARMRAMAELVSARKWADDHDRVARVYDGKCWSGSVGPQTEV